MTAMKTKIILLILLSLVFTPSYAGNSFKVGGISYSVYESIRTDGVLTEAKVEVVNGPDKYAGNIVLPETVSYEGVNYIVGRIGRFAFGYCDKLLSIEFPSSLERIGERAFDGCSALTEIFIPKSVIYIGREAFGGCDALSSIIVEEGNTQFNSYENCNAIIHQDTLIVGCKTTVIPESVTYIEDCAFYSNSGLEYIEIPNTVKGIGENAFFLCNNLSSVVISPASNLMVLENSAFHGCSKLTKLTLPLTLERINDQSLQDCSSLTEIFIPKSVVYIGREAFGGCDALSSIIVEEGNTQFNSYGNCNAIIHQDTLIVGCKTTVIPESVTYIEEYAFYKNSGLEYIEIPHSVKGIGDNAFAHCYNLKEVISFVEEAFELENYVFYGLKNASLYVPVGKIDNYKEKGWGYFFTTIAEIIPNPIISEGGLSFEVYQKRGYAKLVSITQDNKHIVIPSSITHNGIIYVVKEISNSVFAKSNIVSLIIPESITSIGGGVINECNTLASVEWNANFKASSDFVNSIKNPNLLFYVKSAQFAPETVKNVIVGESAEEIVLTDAEYGDFYCPKAFVAKKISYTHHYSLKTQKGVCEGWESIALPFDVQTYITSKGEAKPYKIANNGERLFWLRELTSSGLVEAEGIRANTPYIISLPNWDGYQDFYNINGNLVFLSQNATIEVTDIKSVDATPRHFWPSFQKITRTPNCFALNKDHLIPSETYHGEEHLPGSVFLGNLRDIKPFEAYFTYEGTSAAKGIKVSELLGESTSITNIESDYSISINDTMIKLISRNISTLNIYSATGQLVKKITLAKDCNVVSGLKPGIYIVNGTKILVK